MLWKCSLTVLIGEGADADVVTEERVATDPRLGLELLWYRVQEQLSLLALPVKLNECSLQVLGWCDPIVESFRSADSHQQQRLVDRARSRDEELTMAKLVAGESTPLTKDAPALNNRQGG